MRGPTDATSCHSLTLTASASSSVAATFQLPRFFSRVVCNWAARGSLLETFTRVVLYFYRGIFFILQLSYTCVKAFQRGGKRHRGIRNRVLTNQRDRSYVYAAVSLAAGAHFVGGHIVTYIFSRVIVGSACVRVWKRDCDVTSLVEHRVKGLQ